MSNSDRERMAEAVGRIIDLVHSRPAQKYNNAEDEKEVETCTLRYDEGLWWAESCTDISLVARCRGEDSHNDACLKAADAVQKRALTALQ